MSPAQSEDSGLAAERGTTYATISLPRDNAQNMGIVFLGMYHMNPAIFEKLSTNTGNRAVKCETDRFHPRK